ncbi:MAG: adenylyltransferase/cytidyltransferase family protein [Myxococcales bacterium]|nr:adenylyltransferase/cytidyltransferase family protein [Myxococcales bacterium]
MLVNALSPPQRRKTVALANGVFDLFHVGHLRYLEAASQLAEVLVVAVNSDASTRAYKGPLRPIIPDHERVEIVAGLQCVDHVILFDTPTVIPILQALRPDIHAKGTDYTEATVPEAPIVQQYGGRVVICGDPKNHSSSEVIHRAGLQPGA